MPADLLALDRDSLLRVLALCSVQDVLALACCNKELSQLLKDDDLWQMLAEQKWGHHVRSLAQVAPGGWAAWTRHRLAASSQPVSPLNLVQEQYQACPFQHIAACLLCTRTTGGTAVRHAIRRFLDHWPTPSAVIDASDDSMLEVLQPLGLQAVRLQAVWGLAHDFLAADWQSPSDFKHCGPFVADSWRIFCRGGGSLAGVGDKNLQRYLRWRLHGKVEEAGKRERAAGSRKRRASPPAEAGTLRSGRRRNGTAGGSGGGERRPRRQGSAA